MRNCHLSQLLMDRLGTKSDHKSSPCHYVTGELKVGHLTKLLLIALE